MTRPELAVLLAYAKQSLANALLDSTLPDSRYLEQDLRGYFPHRVVERFADLVPAHPSPSASWSRRSSRTTS